MGSIVVGAVTVGLSAGILSWFVAVSDALPQGLQKYRKRKPVGCVVCMSWWVSVLLGISLVGEVGRFAPLLILASWAIAVLFAKVLVRLDVLVLG